MILVPFGFLTSGATGPVNVTTPVIALIGENEFSYTAGTWDETTLSVTYEWYENGLATGISTPTYVATIGSSVYVFETATSASGISTEPSNIIVLTPPVVDWQDDAYDYFLTENWSTTTANPNTGNVNGWVGENALMSTTRSANDAVLTGQGLGRRSIQPKGNLQMTGHPTGNVGVVFAYKRTSQIAHRLLNSGTPPADGWFIFNGDGRIHRETGNTVTEINPTLLADTAPFDWHTIAIKYDTSSSSVPKIWFDGTLVPNLTIPSFVSVIMNRFGDGGNFDDFELGDFAVYQSPADADMATYGAQLAAKWQAP